MSDKYDRGGPRCELPDCMHAHNVKPARFPPGIVLNGCGHCRDKWGATDARRGGKQ